MSWRPRPAGLPASSHRVWRMADRVCGSVSPFLLLAAVGAARLSAQADPCPHPGPCTASSALRQWRRVVRVCPPSLDKASLGLRYSSCLSARSADKILTSPHLRRPPLCPPRIVYGEIFWWQGNLREGHGLNAACSASGVVSPRAPSRGATRRSYACPIRCACKDWDR